ncbi:MAG: FeoB-associated Cys-rich membrane protein [Ruminococcus sp.]|nr:FeoB-associated Cys-rich membrane protein [Ruminococcus sp.]
MSTADIVALIIILFLLGCAVRYLIVSAKKGNGCGGCTGCGGCPGCSECKSDNLENRKEKKP